MSEWKFAPKDAANRGLTPPRALPDAVGATPSVLLGVAGLGLLGFIEGTLAWIGLRWVADLGWLSEAPAWGPVVGVVMAVTFLRGIDRATFRK